jgi:hypothetical protein
MKRIITVLALLMLASTAYADQITYRPALTFTVDANPTTSTAATTAPSAYIDTVRVMSTVDVFLSIGVSPNASAGVTAMYIPADKPEYFNIRSGEQIAVLGVSASGVVYITEMTQ